MLNPIALAIISHVFVEPARRARAMGLWGAVLGIAMALGPLAGGILTTMVGWRVIFWINIPICLSGVWATRFLPESFGDQNRKLDPLGQVLVIIAMTSLVVTITEMPRHSTISVSLSAMSFGLSTMLAVISLIKNKQPFIEPRYFVNSKFTLSNLCGFAASGGQGILVYTLSIYLQSDLHFTPLSAGMCLVPLALGTFIFSSISGHAVAKLGPDLPLFMGGLLVIASSILLFISRTPLTIVIVIAAVFLFGAGFGLVNAPISAISVMSMGKSAGAAGGVISTSRQLGMSVGIALASSLSNLANGQINNSWVALGVSGVILFLSALVIFRTN